LTLEDEGHHLVEMGPKASVDGEPTPHWHQLYTPSRYAFPTWNAALAFAQTHKTADREVVIVLPDGRRWDGERWVS